MKDRASKTIVVPWDFSESARRALKESMLLVESTKQIRAVNVCRPLSAAEPGVIFGDLDEHAIRERTREKFHETLDSHKMDEVNFVVRFGDPGKEICNYADEIGADLIVMPSHSRGWLGRMIIGSVAERVVRYAPCPVLVLRGEEFTGHLDEEEASTHEGRQDEVNV